MILKKLWAFLLALTVTISSVSFMPGNYIKASAANKFLTLKAAKNTAVVFSEKLEGLDLTLDAKNAALQNAIKSVSAKKKNLSTFRWSPLFSFKFPQKPNLSQAFEFEYKPFKAQVEIDRVKHRIVDTKLAEMEKVEQLFVTIVSLQKNIELNESRIEILEKDIDKNQARLATGDATQSDVDRLNQKLSSIETALTGQQRNLEDSKKSLSKLLGFDVNTGYDFEEPFVESKINRSLLNKIIDYTLEHSDTYYTVSLDAQLAKTALQTNYSLMKNHYSSSEMSIIDSYVRQALAGEDFNAKAFKRSYDRFLDVIEDPWRGKFWILFIPIPKEFLKGSIDGLRFVEDDAYALYSSAMDYKSAYKDQLNTKSDIIKEVTDTFNNYISVRNAYKTYVSNLSKAEREVEKSRILNSIGDMTLEEFEGVIQEYEDAQNEVYNGLADYTSAYYSFDRLTCGALSSIASGTDIDSGVVGGGLSYILDNNLKGAYYYIDPILAQSQFEMGIVIPDDFKANVTDFELWSDGVQIGERTSKNEVLRNLTLTTGDVERVSIRLYDGNNFIDDCVIDANEIYGPLYVTDGHTIVDTSQYLIGTYHLERSDVSNISELTLTPDKHDEIKGYRLMTADGQTPLGGESIVPITTAFKYLRLVESDLDTIKIEYYGEGDALLYKGYFNTSETSIYRDPD